MGEPKHVVASLGTVLGSQESFVRLSHQPVSLGVAKKLISLNSFLSATAKSFDERRDALAAEKGTAIPSEPGNDEAAGKKWKLEPGAMAEFREEQVRLLQEEVRIPPNLCLTAAELSEAKISAGDLGRIAYAVTGLS